MDTLIIKGPQILSGELDVNGAKNGVLPLMVCALLTDNNLRLSNVPILTDVNTMSELLENYGADVNFDKKNRIIDINCRNVNNFNAPSSIACKMRASIWTLAPILAKFGRAEIALPGGCNLSATGARQIDLHTSLLEQMGANFTYDNGYIHASLVGKLQGVNFHFNKVSVGATINAILAAVLADGVSNFTNCAIEPEITDMCSCLVKMGAHIECIGNRELKIYGTSKLLGTEHRVIPDRIEAGTYLIMAAITKGAVKINGINKAMLEALCNKLELVGNKLSFLDDSITLQSSGGFKSIDVATEPFPGFVTDLQAQFMSLMCLANGTSYISENIYDNRFTHVAELNKMGANITIKDHLAAIVGVPKLMGSQVYASDLRASVCLVLAGLAAHGITTINNAEQLSRGYENLVGKLTNCGIIIEAMPKASRQIVA
jgi:UDP-N-acetylglucosamine 1-carboxyvinyltransferase